MLKSNPEFLERIVKKTWSKNPDCREGGKKTIIADGKLI